MSLSSMDSAALKRQRGQLKRKITDLRTFLSQFHDQNKPSSAELKELQLRVDRTTTVLDQQEEIHNKIVQCADINIADEENYLSEFENLYFSTMGQAQDLLDNSVNSNIATHSGTSEAPSVANSVVSHYSNTGLSHIRLPTISLPKFNGQYVNWLEFHDTFASLIDSNESLNKIQKFHYLRASLEQDAIDIVKSLQISEANYDIAWSLLCDRYKNKRLLIQKHLNELFLLKQINRESSQQLREISDGVTKNLRALNALGQATDQWDSIIIHLVSSKLDKQSARDWESTKIEGEVPTLCELQTFLNSRADMLDNLGHCHSDSRGYKDKFVKQNKTFLVSNAACYHCRSSHPLYTCEKFLQLPVHERINRVKFLKLCTNCLRNSHADKACQMKSKGCRKCHQPHNTLLHVDQAGQPESASFSPRQEAPSSSNQNQVLTSQVASNLKTQVLLATARIQVMDSNGQWHFCRAILDSASQSNFICTKLHQKLNLNKQKIHLSIQGINQVVSPIKYQSEVKIKSCVTGFSSKLHCLLIDNICENLSSLASVHSLIDFPDNLQLADTFDDNGSVDMLIGAQLFWSLILQGQIKLGKNQPILQNTQFGWILSGPLSNEIAMSSHSRQCLFTKTLDIQQQLQQFWHVEECPTSKPLSIEEKLCEEHFLKNTKRSETGQYIVSIPWKTSPDCLGESESTATKRLVALEKRLQRNPKLREAYNDFMTEYEGLHHMTKVTDEDNLSRHYIPHHGVINEASYSSKLRVVFDASCVTSTGVSSNAIQLVGPTVQSDLFSILVHFREHAIAFSADIEKMYRQILVKPEDQRYQTILWRKDSSQPIEAFKLNTVTYGTASAPFLATRCLVHIADEHSVNYPDAAQVIKKNIYVDDLLSGASSTAEATQLCSDIIKILQQASFSLHKWVSNDPALLTNLKVAKSPHKIIDLGPNDTAKTLGLYWNPNDDSLRYKIASPSFGVNLTKRQMLSTISQIFDPLGLLSPCVIIGKTIMQLLWQEKLEWDDEVPQTICQKWISLQIEMQQLNNLKIPRHVVCTEPVSLELHGFSDASEMAYCACVYVRSQDSHGQYRTQLVCAKSKVAPLKQLTIPRLELCAAHLLSNLIVTTKEAFGFKVDNIFLWCDSMIVLGWLKQPSNTLKVFVGHRVAEIQTRTQDCTWQHISCTDNPADQGSRGTSPAQLCNSTLWWNGPEWLSLSSQMWPIQTNHLSPEFLPEVKSKQNLTLVTVKLESPFVISNFSNYNRLIRVVSYCFRFISRCRKSPETPTGPLTVSELSNSLQHVVKVIQHEQFNEELTQLSNSKPISPKSKLISLNPFIDEAGVLRVGGRLTASQLNFDQKHPILLPKCHFSKLLFAHEHQILMHAGPQQLLASIRDKFWPLNGKNYAKEAVHKCVRCFRCKPSNVNPQMGNLPEDRVTQNFPFQIVGTDYAGPFLMKDRPGRGAKHTKCYIALFICCVTKAVHLELVTSLSTKAFLDALKRFIARRGKPTKIYSDNGLNFVGANNELRQVYDFLKLNSNEVAEHLATEGVSWVFIPPNSPHFGGVWEAGIKKVKFHLKRTAANACLTFEQFLTFLAQVEAILNSGPLTPMSMDPSDLEPLTPFHLLIGRKLTSIPEEDISGVPDNRLSYFQRVQKLLQQFWARWSSEYLRSLIQRRKWQKSTPNLEVGTMVLIKVDDAPSYIWPVGRVTAVFPGRDNIVRVVQVRTQNGLYKRSASRVYPLPIDNDYEK